MPGTTVYPITIAELVSYSRDADELFDGDEHEHLKEFLAVYPEGGDVLPGTGGVRKLVWPVKRQGKVSEMQVVYLFRDLNMPLYLLAIYPEGERIDFSDAWCAEIEKLVAELIEEHSKLWAHVINGQEKGA